MAFPCNQFGKQEPGSPEDITAFVANYGVKFPMMQKVEVNGAGADPCYKFLTGGTDISWNFAKFLVNGQG